MCAGAFVEQISLSAPASGCACGQALGWLFRQHGGRIEVFRERPDELHSHTHIACKSQIFNDSKRHNIRELLGFLKGRFPGEGPHRRFQGADESDFLIVPWVHTTWGSQGLQKIPSTWCQDTKDIDLLRQDRTEVSRCRRTRCFATSVSRFWDSGKCGQRQRYFSGVLATLALGCAPSGFLQEAAATLLRAAEDGTLESVLGKNQVPKEPWRVFVQLFLVFVYYYYSSCCFISDSASGSLLRFLLV